MMVDVKGLAVAPEVRTNEFVVADALLLLGYLFARVDAVAGGGGERASFLMEAVRGPAPSVCFSDHEYEGSKTGVTVVRSEYRFGAEDVPKKVEGGVGAVAVVVAAVVAVVVGPRRSIWVCM